MNSMTVSMAPSETSKNRARPCNYWSRALLFSFILSLALSGCLSSPAPPVSWKEFSSDSFSISYPEKWSFRSTGSEFALFFLPPKTALVVVVSKGLGPAKTLDEFVEKDKTSMTAETFSRMSGAAVKSLDFVADEPVTFQGLAGRRISFIAYLPDTDLILETTYVYDGTDRYVFTASAPEYAFEKSRPTFDAMLLSFRKK